MRLKEQRFKTSGDDWLKSRLNVLVVDDEQGVLDSLQVILEKNDFVFKGFKNPLDALKELMKNDNYQILVTDYFMDPIHGDELIERVRTFNKKIHILLLTGYKDQAPPLDTLKRLNIQGYCEKSHNFDQLLLWLFSAARVLEQNRDIINLIDKTEEQNNVISELNKSLENSYVSIVESLRLTVDAKDEYTRGHSDRVSYYAQIIGQKLGLGYEEIEVLRVGGYFHDIGKIGVKDQIITKASKLTDEEFAEIKKHPEKGFGILEDNPMFKKILPLIRLHHEKLDGSGYPIGLKDEDIPLLVKIISVADSFDAMMSKRTYRDELGLDKAISELRRCSGTQFDAKVVDAFVSLVEEKWNEIVNAVEDIDKKLILSENKKIEANA